MSKIIKNNQSGKGFFLAVIVLLLIGLGLTAIKTQRNQKLRILDKKKNNIVYAQGTKLFLNGSEYKFTGINVYNLASDYSIVKGCGDNNTQTDVENLFSSLRPNSMVRFFAYQTLARNKNTGTLDFTTFDRIIAAAEKYNIKLIPVLTDQWSHCYQVRKTEAWYAGGYRTDSANGNLAYWDYINQIVPRYNNSTVIGMWEPVNEPTTDNVQNNCSTTAEATLKSFFDNVGSRIHSLDPNHLVSSGMHGVGNCGARGDEYQIVHSSPGIDVGSYHDYTSGPIPGDQWNGLQVRIKQMATLNKPLYIGEVGIKARDNVSSCTTTARRRDIMKQKMDAQFSAGIVGFVPWLLVKPNSKTDCNSDSGYEIEQDEDVLQILLHNYVLPEGGM